MKNLPYAEHCFDSTTRPLRRMILHFEALVMTAVDKIRKRRPASLEHRGGNSAVEILNTEPTLQLGTVADACEMVVLCIRCLDNERFDHIQALRASAHNCSRTAGAWGARATLNTRWP